MHPSSHSCTPPTFGLIPTREAAAALGVHEETMRRWVRDEDYPPGMPLRPVKVGGRFKWPASEVRRFVHGTNGNVPLIQTVSLEALDVIALACADQRLIAKVNALSRRRLRLAERLAESWWPIMRLALGAERDGLTLDEALQREQVRVDEEEAAQVTQAARWNEVRLTDKAARQQLDAAARARREKAEAELKDITRSKIAADKDRGARMRRLLEAGVSVEDAERLVGPAADEAARTAQLEMAWRREDGLLCTYLSDPLRRASIFHSALREALEQAAQSGDFSGLGKDAPYRLTSDEDERERNAVAQF